MKEPKALCWACETENATMRGGLCGDCWAESGGTARYLGEEI